MTTVGIDQINFFTSHLYVEMGDLARARNEEPDKYYIGIGQTEQAVIPRTQDAVTLAANAAAPLLVDENLADIAEVIFASESGVDNSKSGAVYLQRLLNLPRTVRTIEMKHACYAGTFALMNARDYVRLHPTEKVLVVATDIARYGLRTPGEVTQGGGAVAMLVTSNPRILALEDDNVFISEDLMDFWRPIYSAEAKVDGHFSQDVYRDFFKEVWGMYKEKHGRTIADFDAFAFHLPYTKQGLKAIRDILPEATDEQQQVLMDRFEASRVYNKRVGNLYTGSLYLSLLSLLANGGLQAGTRLGLFSYGSGAEGEFFSGILQLGYEKNIRKQELEDLLYQRQRLSVAEYEDEFNHVLQGAENIEFDLVSDPAKFVLTGLRDDQRQYYEQNGNM